MFLPLVCTDNFNFNIWANSCFSVSVRSSHFANPARNSDERTVGELARTSVPSAAGMLAPVRRGERLREWLHLSVAVLEIQVPEYAINDCLQKICLLVGSV